MSYKKEKTKGGKRLSWYQLEKKETRKRGERPLWYRIENKERQQATIVVSSRKHGNEARDSCGTR